MKQWKPNPKESKTNPKSKPTLFIDLQIITYKQAQIKKHIKVEDTVELFQKHKLN